MTQRSFSKTRDLSLRVLAISLPGALCLGSFGFGLGMLAIGMGGLPPSHPEVICTFFWGVFGGGCLGATPGLVAGWYWGLKWVRPFLGAAVGALLSVPIVVALDLQDLARSLGIGRDLVTPICATLVMLGFILGVGALFFGSRDKPERFDDRH